MAGRERSSLRAKARGEASSRRAAESTSPGPLLYTAQDVARFCEVDLKTVHHWADAGKIPHHRTIGRHLRFHRNDVVAFLRAHGYPLHGQITTARPTVFFAVSTTRDVEEVTKRLAQRFGVRRFASGVAAIAHLVAEGPDALVLSRSDATWAGAHALAALKSDPATSWIVLVVVGDATESGGEDLALAAEELARLPAELARQLAMD